MNSLQIYLRIAKSRGLNKHQKILGSCCFPSHQQDWRECEWNYLLRWRFVCSLLLTTLYAGRTFQSSISGLQHPPLPKPLCYTCPGLLRQSHLLILRIVRKCKPHNNTKGKTSVVWKMDRPHLLENFKLRSWSGMFTTVFATFKPAPKCSGFNFYLRIPSIQRQKEGEQ